LISVQLLLNTQLTRTSALNATHAMKDAEEIDSIYDEAGAAGAAARYGL